MTPLQNAFQDLATEATLAALLAELGQKLESGPVALDATTLAALETINAVVSGQVGVSNFPADQKTHDDYQAGEVLADQPGAAGVLTFTFTGGVAQLVVVTSTGASLTARADPFGGTPAANLGIRCDDGVPTYVPVATSAVKVFAPVGTSVSVYGLRRG